MVLEKTLENPLDSKEIKPVNPKGNKSWIFIGRIDVEAEAPILWPPDAKNWLTRKDADDGKDQRQEEKGTTKDEMVGWYYQMIHMSLRQEGQGSLVCCSPWGHKELDTTEWLNWLIICKRYKYKYGEKEMYSYIDTHIYFRALGIGEDKFKICRLGCLNWVVIFLQL